MSKYIHDEVDHASERMSTKTRIGFALYMLMLISAFFMIMTSIHPLDFIGYIILFLCVAYEAIRLYYGR